MSALVPFAWRARRVRAASTEIAAFEAGAGDARAPCVVLVHGLGHWSDAAWSRLVPHLDGARRYVAFDLPGFGASAKPAVRYDAAYFARVLDEVTAALAPERFALVGHSLGGFIAADFAGRHPERVGRLALIAPAGFTRAPRHVGFSLLARAIGAPLATRAPSRRFVRRIVERAVHDPASIDEAHVERAYALAQELAMRRAFTGVYAAAADLFTGRDAVHARFARYAGPVLCAWGRHDRYIRIDALRAVRRVYPRAETLVLERSAHLPMVEEPFVLGAALDTFLG
ncbi:MAG TPA: alpha/beta hydrolase [Candidatus Elarobacter sp.]|nr:alpha/beta hydrolase [Candidatus Elarobacter sp.]